MWTILEYICLYPLKRISQKPTKSTRRSFLHQGGGTKANKRAFSVDKERALA